MTTTLNLRAFDLGTLTWSGAILTISTAALLCCLYSLYSGYVSPLVDPHLQPRARARVPLSIDGDRPTKNLQMAKRFLPKEAWAREARYQFLIGEVLIYAQQARREGDAGEIHFTKFAMIMLQTSGGSDDAITAVSEAARLKFASNINLENAQPGRIVEGSLQGKTSIEGPKGLKLDGRDFIFSEKALRVWSDYPVKFEYGPHSGNGKGLQLNLIAGTNALSRDMPGIAGIRLITLRKDVHIELSGEEDDADPQDQGSFLKPGDHVTISCKEEFQYDLEQDQMTFETNVQAIQPTKEALKNTLDCDRLVLQFRRDELSEATTVVQVSQPPAVARGERSAAADGKSPPSGSADSSRRLGLPERLIFERAEAEGREGRPALIISDERELRAEALVLKYDAVQKVIEFHGEAKIEQGPNEIQCPHVTLRHDANQQWKTADCTGAGTLTTRNAENGEFRVRWKEFLKKYPDPTNGLDVVKVEGQAAASNDEMALDAESITIWVLPKESESEADSDSDVAESTAHTPDLSQGLPQRLLARRKVTMKSETLNASTEELEVRFEKADLAADTPAAPATRQPAARADSAKNPAGKKAGAKAPAQDPAKPLQLVADSIRVRALRDTNDSKRTEPAEIWAVNHVHLMQERAENEPPLDLDGQQLYVKQTGKEQHQMQLTGLPAHIRDRGQLIQGADIRMDTASNNAEVRGEGLLQIPVTSTLEGKPLENPQRLDVNWKERMTFDGKFANFYGDVRTVLEESRVECQSMRIELSKKISFMDQQSAAAGRDGSPEILHILCQDDVKINRFEYERNSLMGVQRLEAVQFTADFTAGRKAGITLAQGPGRLFNWQRGDGKRAGFSPVTSAKANRPLLADAWEYTFIKFSGPMKGNIAAKSTTFEERVEVVHGPVAQPNDTVDPDELPRDSGWMVCDKLTLIQHEDTNQESKEKQSYVTMLGTGNVRMKGQYLDSGNNDESEMHIFHAGGDSIKFDGNGKKYIIRSLAPPDAWVERQTKAGKPGGGGHAKWIEFNPALNRLKMDRASGLDGVP